MFFSHHFVSKFPHRRQFIIICSIIDSPSSSTITTTTTTTHNHKHDNNKSCHHPPSPTTITNITSIIHPEAPQTSLVLELAAPCHGSSHLIQKFQFKQQAESPKMACETNSSPLNSGGKERQAAEILFQVSATFQGGYKQSN